MRVLFTEDMIRDRVSELAMELVEEWGQEMPIAMVVLNGGMFFAADLLREIQRPLLIDSLAVKSYVGTQSSGSLEWVKKPGLSMKGRHIILIDDILDSGLTRKEILSEIALAGASQVTTVTFLTRSGRPVPPNHRTGFYIGSEFVIGYGLDHDGRYRNLPFIAAFE